MKAGIERVLIRYGEVSGERVIMRREELFNRDGVYSTLVTCNLLMHREATETGIGFLKILSDQRKANRPIRVLDLACGSLPVAIADMMERVPHARFSYTGVDINPDQVELASRYFRFSDNVRCADFIEGNAWDLHRLNLKGPYDMIFTGFNLHHGTPEEIDFLMVQVDTLLAGDGIFLNHDWYRPDEEIYVRRPSCNPQDPSESYRLVPKASLSDCTLPYERKSIVCNFSDHAWRMAFIDGLTDSFRRHRDDQQGANSLKSHMVERDFPVSRQDLADILMKHGFFFDFIHHHDPRIAICPYLAMPFACKDEGLYGQVLQAIKVDEALISAAVA